MKLVWILNFALPIVSLFGIGVLIDRMVKPDAVPEQEIEE